MPFFAQNESWYTLLLMAVRLLLVISGDLKQEILKYCHDFCSSGHLVQDKIVSKLRKIAFWHGMATNCKLYVSSCPVSNKQKKANRKARVELG